jgi:glucosamine-phosphate N-acetyltransferase
MYKIRNIEYNDYYKNYLHLLQKLTTIDPDKISSQQFNSFIDNLTNKHQILVIEDPISNKIIGTITIMIEPKLIHNLGSVCHIEDLVVDNTMRGLGLGKLLVNKANEIGKEQNCYKTILDCEISNAEFYKKCNFINKGLQMSLYY